MRLPPVWTPGARSSACGASVSLRNVSPAWTSAHARVGPGLFPPELVVDIKALACQLPSTHGLPRSRWSIAEVTREACRSGLVATLRDRTVWRWLHADAIRPWRQRCWIFPRDPQFADKAGRILDLYEKVWQGQPLRDDEFVVSADEKTSIQARARLPSTLPAQPASPLKVEHEYERRGAWAYWAALDVHRFKLLGRCEPTTGIVPFDRLVAEVMAQAPYRDARRVFWIFDNGSSHRGERCGTRLRDTYPHLVPVHGPVHASWLNQIEIYFSVLQRKALTPNDFPSLDALRDRILGFERYYEGIAQPFEWKFTRCDLEVLLNKLNTRPTTYAYVAA